MGRALLQAAKQPASLVTHVPPVSDASFFEVIDGEMVRFETKAISSNPTGLSIDSAGNLYVADQRRFFSAIFNPTIERDGEITVSKSA
jgi:hypothetical protein